ncbi:MAG TPA: hypothetical protein PKD37_05465 [Oligoflexia bacterium]|nr:hypothetical protein [Oligoflexia bacterium]HMP27414.1 hypothetical protein [Oligoflexia bacterium]
MSEINHAKILATDPGNPLFTEYARILVSKGRLQDALMVCLRGLSADSANHMGRLILAKIYFELKFYPFALAELRKLKSSFPESKDVKKLCTLLSGEAMENLSGDLASDKEATASDIVAEAEFDFEQIDLIDKTASKKENNEEN